MQFLTDNWPLVLAAAAIVIIVLWLLLRPRQRVQLTDSAPTRPHMAYAKPPEGAGLPGEAATAFSNVAGEVIEADVHRALHGEQRGDDLSRLKGVGPKFADALNGLGFNRFEQIANLTPTEIERIDTQLGAFRGRISRDQIVDQADYLARNDIDGFEQKFGKL